VLTDATATTPLERSTVPSALTTAHCSGLQGRHFALQRCYQRFIRLDSILESWKPTFLRFPLVGRTGPPK
jgi:hypothetical protein